MKKILLAGVVALFGFSNAQIQKDNWMLGGQVANAQFTNGLNINLTPQVGYFLKDNWAVGAKLGTNIYSLKGVSGVQAKWNLGAFTRYYLNKNDVSTLLKNGRFFGEATVGLGGDNSSHASSTNGAQLGIGAGYAYFITKNVSLDAILKFDATVGVGSSTGNGNIGLNVGFQIFLPTSKVQAALKDKQ